MSSGDGISIYAKPVAPRIVVRPALATALLHGLLVLVLTANWADSSSRVITANAAPPKVITARLVDASEFRPEPKPAKPVQKQVTRPAPKVTAKPAQSKPAPKPTPKPAPKPAAKKAQPKPEPKPEPKPKPEPRMTQAELAALARADLARAMQAEESAAVAAATAAEMTASYAALIQQTVINYWSRPPSARNGMEAELSIQLIPTGDIVNVVVLRGSGNSAFDRSAVNAVKKAGSFPELQNLPQAEFERNFRRFRLLFRPEDLRY